MKCQIVILNWNGEDHLRRFLPSVIATTPEWTEVVVADNGSTDGSLELLRSDFRSVRIVELDRNWGFAEGYNRALSTLSADFFILLNSDVECTEGWVEPLIEALESDRALMAVSPKIVSYAARDRFEYAGASGGFIDSLGYPFCRGRILDHIENDCGQYDDRRYTFWASGACMACRRELFDKQIGGFDARFFAHQEEIDLCWRAQLMGYKIAVEPKSKVYHLGGGTLPNNSPNKLYLNFRNNLAMLYKNLPANRRWVVPLRMVMDGGSAAVYLLMGRWHFVSAVWRAHRDFGRWRKELCVERTRIAEATVVQPDTIYKGSILLGCLLGRNKFDKMI